MTSAAVVLPDAAVRMMRAVAGRRALQVVLLLAGLLVLGFLCGERAHAVDGVPPGPERVQSARASEPVRERVAEPEPEPEPVRERVVEPVRNGVGKPVAEAAEPAVRATQGVARPVVDGVTGVLEGAPQRVLPEGRASDIPGMPGRTGMPSVPEAPDLPRPDPGAELQPLQPPHGGDKPGAGQSDDADARAHEARKSSAGRGGSSYGTGAGVGTGITYPGGQQAHASSLFDGDTSDAAHGTGHEPFPPAPGDPGRTLAGQSVGDGSSTRHGDPGAASFDSRAPVRLLQGAGAGQVLAPIGERHRDIPEFPG